MTDFPYDNEALLPFRVRENSKKIERLEAWRAEVDTSRAAEKVQAENMAEAMAALTDTVNGLRRALIGFALTIAASAIVFALTVLSATGKI